MKSKRKSAPRRAYRARPGVMPAEPTGGDPAPGASLEQPRRFATAVQQQEGRSWFRGICGHRVEAGDSWPSSCPECGAPFGPDPRAS